MTRSSCSEQVSDICPQRAESEGQIVPEPQTGCTLRFRSWQLENLLIDS